MKKVTLLVAGLLLTGSLATASELSVFSGNATYHNNPVDYREAEPVVFIERGIEFMVFPNGEMDFNTQPGTTSTNYYRTGSRANATYGAPGKNDNRGVRVDHDVNGLVRRVGNVYINYDYAGRVKRIGTVYMSYNNYALTQIGLLNIMYDRQGRIIDTRGYVNNANRGRGYEPVYAYNANPNNGYNGNGGNYNNGGRNDNNNNNTYYRTAAPAGGSRSAGEQKK